jgi:hypothetical protein
MKKLTVQQKIAHAASGAAVLRTLVITDAKLTYQQFGEAIGLITGKWEPWHRSQVSDVLYAISAIEKRRPDGSSKLDYGRVVSKQGKPGKGLGKTSAIVVR